MFHLSGRGLKFQDDMFIFKIYLASNYSNMMMPEDQVCSSFWGEVLERLSMLIFSGID
jgi:hypothetical protein